MDVNVSVIVPIYNAEKKLKQCIESILIQTLKDIEIILVDDGSTDSSPEICDELSTRDGRIIVIHKDNEGVAKARNDGLKRACGDYIIFSDADDFVPGDAYEKLYRKAVQTDADIVIGDVCLVKDNTKRSCHFYEKDFETNDKQLIDKLIMADFYRNYCPMPYRGKAEFGYGGPWNKLVKKELLDKNEIQFNSRLRGVYDDILYTAYILFAARKVTYISKPVYDYYIYGDSITHKYKKDMLEINREIFTAWNDFLKQDKNMEKFLPAYYANVLRRLSESLDYYYYHEEQELKGKKLNKAILNMIREEPYRDIEKNIDVEVLSLYHKALVFALHFKSPKILKTIHVLRRVGKTIVHK